MKRVIGLKASTCSSDQMPVSAREMRPTALTAVASVITSPAPPTARDPRCTRCQLVGAPSEVAEYWHIGETQRRLRASTSRSLIDSKRALMELLLLTTDVRTSSISGRTL